MQIFETLLIECFWEYFVFISLRRTAKLSLFLYFPLNRFIRLEMIVLHTQLYQTN